MKWVTRERPVIARDEIQRVFSWHYGASATNFKTDWEFAKQRCVIFGGKHRGHSSANAVKDERAILVFGERLPSA